jgi:hypothetical protein
MDLPKISHPTFETTLPSTGKSITFRPIKGRERKKFLMALEGKDEKEIQRCVRETNLACLTTGSIDQFTTFDHEWLYLQLMINSVKEELSLQTRIINRESECEECGKPKRVKVNLRDAKIVGLRKDKKDFQIDLGGGNGIKLRYPTEQIVSALSPEGKTEEQCLLDIFSTCVECVYDAEKTYPFDEFSYEKKIAYIEDLSVQAYDKLEAFSASVPTLFLEVPIVCEKCGYKTTSKLEGLLDFFV